MKSLSCHSEPQQQDLPYTTLAPLPRSKKSNSPFRYPGGKFYARQMILEVLPQHDAYCEPFAGGASVFFAKPKSSVSTLNDLDEDVINTFIQIRDHVEDLIRLLDGIPATKQNHAYYKDEYQPETDLERAFRWYYLNRTSYSGIMRAENWPPHLRTVSDKLQDVELTRIDSEEAIEAAPDSSFLFVDPPYYNADQQKFYNCTFILNDHKRLAKCLKHHSDRVTFLLTYDEHDEVRQLYEWTKSISKKQWNYTINRTDDQKHGIKKKDGFRRSRYKGCEVFIRNYSVWQGY